MTGVLTWAYSLGVGAGNRTPTVSVGTCLVVDELIAVVEGVGGPDRSTVR